MKKSILAGLAAVAVAAPIALAAAPAQAADGNLVQNGNFEQVGPLGSGTTPLKWSAPGFQGQNVASDPTGMYAPGMYTIATDPSSVHSQWTPFTGHDHMMIVN